jgi:hypothetical protein
MAANIISGNINTSDIKIDNKQLHCKYQKDFSKEDYNYYDCVMDENGDIKHCTMINPTNFNKIKIYVDKGNSILYCDHPTNKIVGIANLGNTCFINVVLQIFYNNVKIRNAILDENFEKVDPDKIVPSNINPVSEVLIRDDDFKSHDAFDWGQIWDDDSEGDGDKKKKKEEVALYNGDLYNGDLLFYLKNVFECLKSCKSDYIMKDAHDETLDPSQDTTGKICESLNPLMIIIFYLLKDYTGLWNPGDSHEVILQLLDTLPDDSAIKKLFFFNSRTTKTIKTDDKTTFELSSVDAKDNSVLTSPLLEYGTYPDSATMQSIIDNYFGSAYIYESVYYDLLEDKYKEIYTKKDNIINNEQIKSEVIFEDMRISIPRNTVIESKQIVSSPEYLIVMIKRKIGINKEKPPLTMPIWKINESIDEKYHGMTYSNLSDMQLNEIALLILDYKILDAQNYIQSFSELNSRNIKKNIEQLNKLRERGLTDNYKQLSEIITKNKDFATELTDILNNTEDIDVKMTLINSIVDEIKTKQTVSDQKITNMESIQLDVAGKKVNYKLKSVIINLNEAHYVIVTIDENNNYHYISDKMVRLITKDDKELDMQTKGSIYMYEKINDDLAGGNMNYRVEYKKYKSMHRDLQKNILAML